MIKVAKVGGSSLADGRGFFRVKDILESDPQRRVLIVSAPGKSDVNPSKVTDLLYLCHAHIKYNISHDSTLDKVKARFNSIAFELGIEWDEKIEFASLYEGIKNGAGEEWLASRGEYLCAKMMAVFLGWTFIDAAECIFFTPDGKIDTEKTYAAVAKAVEKAGGKAVIPGFYGAGPMGEVVLFQRGGSDVTGAIVAAALKASVYENWTDVDGILMADPKIVKHPRVLPKISYHELGELTNMGASVLHDEAVEPVKNANVPINIRNTLNPTHPGTIIDGGALEGEMTVSGIAGKKNYTIISAKIPGNSGVAAAVPKCMEAFSRNNVPVEYVNVNGAKIEIMVATEKLKPYIYAIAGEIQALCTQVEIAADMAILAVVGRPMAMSPAVLARVFTALSGEKIDLFTAFLGVEKTSLLLAVENQNFEKAVNALYSAFVKE